MGGKEKGKEVKIRVVKKRELKIIEEETMNKK